jgi:hypothetical protein
MGEPDWEFIRAFDEGRRLPPKPIGLGFRSGRLLVIEPRERGSAFIKARCNCGVEKMIAVSSIRYGCTKSCGCLRRERVLTLERLIAESGPPGTPQFKRMVRRMDGMCRYMVKIGELEPDGPGVYRLTELGWNRARELSKAT